MSDTEAENAIVPHQYTLQDVLEKENMTSERNLTHALSNSKEFPEWITSVKV